MSDKPNVEWITAALAAQGMGVRCREVGFRPNKKLVVTAYTRNLKRASGLENCVAGVWHVHLGVFVPVSGVSSPCRGDAEFVALALAAKSSRSVRHKKVDTKHQPKTAGSRKWGGRVIRNDKPFR